MTLLTVSLARAARYAALAGLTNIEVDSFSFLRASFPLLVADFNCSATHDLPTNNCCKPIPAAAPVDCRQIHWSPSP